MALPTTSLRPAVQRVLQEAGNIKRTCASGAKSMAEGPVSANGVLECCQRLRTLRETVFQPVLDDPQLFATLADELRSASVVALRADLETLIAAMTAAIAQIVLLFPTSNTQPAYLLKDILHPDGSISVRQFLPEHTAALRAALQNVADAIQ